MQGGFLGPMISDVRDYYIDGFLFSKRLKYDISVSITVFVSEIPLKLRYIFVFRHENRSISDFRKIEPSPTCMHASMKYEILVHITIPKHCLSHK